MGQGLPDRLPGRPFPEASGAVFAPSQDGLAVGTECRRFNETGLGQQKARLSGGHFPQAGPPELPVTRVWSSGLNATARTTPVCCKGIPRGWPVAASHSRAVLSALPVATVFPSWL